MPCLTFNDGPLRNDRFHRGSKTGAVFLAISPRPSLALFASTTVSIETIREGTKIDSRLDRGNASTCAVNASAGNRFIVFASRGLFTGRKLVTRGSAFRQKELSAFGRGPLCARRAKFDRLVARRNGIGRFVRPFVRTFRLRQSRIVRRFATSSRLVRLVKHSVH